MSILNSLGVNFQIGTNLKNEYAEFADLKFLNDSNGPFNELLSSFFIQSANFFYNDSFHSEIKGTYVDFADVPSLVGCFTKFYSKGNNLAFDLKLTPLSFKLGGFEINCPNDVLAYKKMNDALDGSNDKFKFDSDFNIGVGSGDYVSEVKFKEDFSDSLRSVRSQYFDLNNLLKKY
ncbi:hypothetical protein K9L67_04415 [Candidatus Woesearchaeota archaeon]|nr:hypothetical protein [Candidatus Woesearchaeota archaeon]MCF7901443.1 hypothetical protein [Candidatus Woesearchaeota archaeon]MCF8013011.1 hypothetical protein [Candidatus Woesearchaeota archaeon]